MKTRLPGLLFKSIGIVFLAAGPSYTLHKELRSRQVQATESNVTIKAEIMKDTTYKDMPPLTAEEKRIIIHGGTERPFTGKLLENKEDGTYICRQCGAALFPSDTKFDSRSGWPSFDDSLPGAVSRKPDADGSRTEIQCASCGGHLGHVFEGEGFTSKNTRHCVNSLSLAFEPAGPCAVPGEELKYQTQGNSVQDMSDNAAPAMDTAIFAAGCFWGVEDAFRKVDGVLDVVSGYTGGHAPDPDYEEVCTGNSGHAEAVLVTYDPTKVSYEKLARLFFEIHDPSQYNRQGPDIGSQYRSSIFYKDKEQKDIAEALVYKLLDRGFEVATEVVPATTFYPAEEYHQNYAARTGRGACHMRVPRFDAEPV